MEFMMFIWSVLVLCSMSSMSCLSIQKYSSGKGVEVSEAPLTRSLWKRFIDTSSSLGGFSHPGSGVAKIRTRRSWEQQCEQLRLCRLHARSSTSLLAAFELYFVNRENARLWDHRARSPADCERRYSCDR